MESGNNTVGQVGSARDPAFLRAARPILERFASYFRPEVRGFERLPQRGPFLVVGNHSGGQMPPDLPVLLTAWWRERGEDSPDPCYQLNEVNVGTLQSFSTLDGPTDEGPQWINLLTDGVTDPAPVDRMAIAKAVDSSEASATQLISSLPLSLQSPARRLVAVAGSPTASVAERSSVGIRADVRELSDYAFQACGDAG